ncbi:MAG: phage tail family protein [Clostridia bacterium]|nr:phage tail family protein [Clostridia bacterium]
MAGNKHTLKLVLKLGNASIVIGGDETESPFRLLSSGIDGIEGVEAAVMLAENAQLDGSTAISCRVPGREITIRFEVASLQHKERYREQLLSFFAPKASGTLTVCRDDITERTIGCMLYGSVTMTEETLYDYIRVQVPLYCPDPYFQEETAPRILTKKGVALLTFPLTLMPDSGMTASEAAITKILDTNNCGDTETGFLLYLKMREKVQGEGVFIVNPCVTKSSDGTYIRILGTFTEGETITICTLPGAKYILRNGVKSMHFARGSTFFSLDRGNNRLVLSADEQKGEIEAILSFRARYFGV